MPFYRCFYHIVWATKHRSPWLLGPVETLIYAQFSQKCEAMGGDLLAVNGTTDHVHLVLVIPPSISVATVVKNLKGTSAREVNQQFELDYLFRWQGGYSVFTFGEKVLPDVLRYVADQKIHHAEGTMSAYLEHIGDE